MRIKKNISIQRKVNTSYYRGAATDSHKYDVYHYFYYYPYHNIDKYLYFIYRCFIIIRDTFSYI